MNITIATGLYPPEIGGPATYTALLESALPAHGCVVTTVPFGTVRHYPKIIRHVVYAWKLWRASKKADIIYALDPVSVGVPALLVAKILNKKFLLRIPGDYAWEQGQLRFGVKDRLHDFIEKRFKYGFKVSALCYIESFVAQKAVRVVVPSSYMKSVVMKWGVNEGDISVIYSALYPLEVKEGKEVLRKKFEFAYPTLVSAGRLVPNKGFIQLLEVFVRIRLRYKDAQLIIVGEGPQYGALLKKAEELSIADAVRLVGQLSKEALGATIKAADVFVLNTAHEGLSHQLIEVMDIGIPIVTTNVGGNPELITDGVNGFLVEYNDVGALSEAVVRVLDHPESRERIVQSARAQSKQFSKEKVIEEIVTLFKQLNP